MNDDGGSCLLVLAGLVLASAGHPILGLLCILAGL